MGPYQTNCYIVSIEDNDIIIDPGVNALPWIIDTAKNPIAILNTHGHFDHVWSNTEVKNHYNIPIYCPIDDVFMLENDPLSQGAPKSVADFIVKPNESILLLEKIIKFHHFPGHTPGTSALQIDNSLFVGDFIFKNSIGRVDFPFSNPEDMKKSLTNILSWDKDFTLYNGHGESTTLNKERESLKAWIKVI
jgi:glyoxylase-like metal-dependent hydrolase (beta-lactamase superfamily II)